MCDVVHTDYVLSQPCGTQQFAVAGQLRSSVPVTQQLLHTPSASQQLVVVVLLLMTAAANRALPNAELL